jgi:nucleoid DNA-binding protein
MTKGELVDRVSTNTGLSKRQTKEALAGNHFNSW